MHQFPEHCINHLDVGWPSLLNVIFSGSVILKLIQPEIPPLLRDNLHFTFPLLLVFLDPFVLINLVHELTHTSNSFASERLPQTMPSREADFKSADCHVLKVSVHHVVHFPIPSEYVLKPSPSRMDRDSSESNGQHTLLHVIKREPKA